MDFISALINWLMWWMIPQDFVSEQQAIIPAVIAIAGLAAQGYGMYKKSQADKSLQAKQEALNAQMGDLSSWYNAESSKDFLDTDSGQSAIAKIREQYKKALETNGSNAAKGGLTAEAKVANQGNLQEKYNSAITNLTGYGTQYKQNMKRDYANSLQSMYGNNAATYGPESASWGNFMGNAAQLTSSAAGAEDWDKLFASKETA